MEEKPTSENQDEKVCYKCLKKIETGEPYTHEEQEYCCEHCCHVREESTEGVCEFC